MTSHQAGSVLKVPECSGALQIVYERSLACDSKSWKRPKHDTRCRNEGIFGFNNGESPQ